MKTDTSAKEILKLISTKIKNNEYKNSVHKIKLMTARDMIEEILESEF